MPARLRSTLRGLWRRNRLESELDAELSFHIDAHAEELRRRGLSPTEALRRARLEFGGVESIKEECRDSVGLRLWDELRADLRYAWRQLSKSRVFAVVAVLSIGLGIGANTAIYTLTREVLFKPLGVPHAERLQIFSWVRSKEARSGPLWGSFGRNAHGAVTGTPFPYPLYLQMRRHNQSSTQPAFEDLVAFKDVYRLTAIVDGIPEAIDGMLVSGNFYPALAPRVIAGRGLAPDDDRLAAEPVALISDAYWAERFDRSPNVLGKVVSIAGTAVTVVGVNGAEFRGPRSGGRPQVFLPLSLQPRVSPMEYGSLLEHRSFWWVAILGRLTPGVSPETAQSALDTSFRSAFQTTLPEKREEDRPRFLLESGSRGLDHQRNQFRQPLFVLLSLAGIVLLIACANLANLLLARSAARRREMSLRLALGAGRGRILRQVLTEALLLASLGGLAGLVLGYLGRNAIPRLFEDAWTARGLDVEPDATVLFFATGLTLLTGLLFGLAPAWRATRQDVQSSLQETTRTSLGRRRAGLGKALVAVQIALCALLVVGAGLFLRTLSNLRGLDLGLATERIVLFQIDPPRSSATERARVALFQSIEDRLTGVPGVQLATLSSEPLLANSMANGCFRPASRPAGETSNDADDVVWTNHVGARFFETFGLRVPLGRVFDAGDGPAAPRVGVINQQVAQRFFPGQSALGQSLVECDAEGDPRPIEVVGVSVDAKYSSLRDEVPPTIYLSYRQAQDLGSVTYEVKTAASLASIAPALRQAVRAVDPQLPLLDLRTQEQQVDATLTQERVFATLASSFGLVALLLASIGIYGVMAYNISRRTQEIGIRKALGAQAGEVVSMVLHETARVAGVGVIAGMALAIAATRLLSSMLFGLRATDPLTYLGAALLLSAIALLAGWIPAHRAASVDANTALRHE